MIINNIVVGHCIQYGSGSEYLTYAGFLYSRVFIFIYSFHMPLFMLVSGYLFFYSCKDKSCKQSLLGKFKQIIVPLFCWSFVTLFVQIIKTVTGVSTQNITLLWMGQSIISGFLYGPWFLWAIWWCSFFIIVGKSLFKDNLIFYLLLCLVSFVIPDIDNTALYKFVWPFFLLGYIFNKYDLKSKLNKVYLNKVFVIACFLSFIFLLRFYNFNTYIYTTGFYILDKNVLFQIHNNGFRFFIGLVGSVSMMYLVYGFVRVAPNMLNKVFSYIGKCTLGIYLVSNYLFDEVLKRIPILEFNWWYILREVTCVLIVSILVTYVLKKVKFTNIFFLGGR